MPTPQAYDKLYREHEELRWATFRLMCAMSPEAGVDDSLHNQVWDIVGDCEGPPSWLAEQLE